MEKHKNSEVFELALQFAPNAVLICESNGRIVSANEKFAELTGVSLGLVVDGNINDFFPVKQEISGEGVFQLKPCSEEISGESYLFRVRNLGEQSSPLAVAYFISDADGPMAGNMNWREEKLASLGTLAGEISHDLNNLLTGILGHVSYLRLSLPEKGDHTESVSAIEEAAKGAALMTQRVLEFAKGEEGKFGVVNLASVVRTGTNLLEAALPKNIQFKISGLDRDTAIVGDEIALSQIVMNLVVNARDALPDGGVIGISLDSMTFESAPAGVKPAIKPGHYAALTISDNGTGIEEKVLEKIFEPFFTTKSERGTGLGLSTVISIVSKHGGGISLRSKVGKGTDFMILLPLHHECQASVEETKEEIPTGSENILIVDDEDTVRTVLQRSLELLGYKVVSASGGHEAIEAFQGAGGDFALVILDMMMPKMAGDEVFERLKEIDAGVAVLIASGYSSDGKTRKILDNGGLGFIQKPFAVEDLAVEVRRCIEESKNA